MSAILRGVMGRTAPMLKPNVTHKATLVSGPPRVRISIVEKFGLGSLMILAIIAPMGYIMANILNYRQRPGEENN